MLVGQNIEAHIINLFSTFQSEKKIPKYHVVQLQEFLLLTTQTG